MSHYIFTVTSRAIPDSKKVGYTLTLNKDGQVVSETPSTIDFFTPGDALDVGRLDAGQRLFELCGHELENGTSTYEIKIEK